MSQFTDHVIAPRVSAVENMVARARAKTGKRPGPPACPTCHIPLWLSFFFDGTDNHKDRDFPKRHSNVVALFQAHLDAPESGIRSFYYEGCGTAFSFSGRHVRVARAVGRSGRVVLEDREGYDEEESTYNQALGDEIDKRLEKAIYEFESFVEDRRARVRVDEINVAAFGFSRGATTARAFAHWLAAHSKVTRTGAKLKYDGIPLNFKFIGIFDTVESIGVKSQNSQAKLIKTSVPGFVEKCLHSVAVHEMRPSFPLTNLDGGRHTTVASPGAHSDIGGGYLAGEQVRNRDLSKINLLQMLDHARGASLKMMSLGEMRTAEADRWETTFKHSFHVTAQAHTLLATYLGHVRITSGPLPEVFRAHMEWFWLWIDSGLAAEDTQQKFKEQWQAPGQSAAARRSELMKINSALGQTARTDEGKGFGGLTGQPTHPIRNRTLPAAVEDMLENYVHDSQAAFLLYGFRMKDTNVLDYYRIRPVLRPLA